MEVRINSEELVLGTSSSTVFSGNTVYLGIAKDFGENQGKPTIQLDPLYKIVRQVRETTPRFEITEPSVKLLFPKFFRTIYAGPAEAIASGLREPPFSGMEELADVVETMHRPYDIALRNLKKYFEHRDRIVIAKTG